MKNMKNLINCMFLFFIDVAFVIFNMNIKSNKFISISLLLLPTVVHMCIIKVFFKKFNNSQKGIIFALLAVIITISTILLCSIGYWTSVFDAPDILFIILVVGCFFFTPALVIAAILYNKT